MIRKLFFIFLFCGFFSVFAVGISVYLVYDLVVLHPGSEIEAGNIQAILGQESPVYYRDGETKLGVFFDDAHRQYVQYEEIPIDFIDALVAAEDNMFFSHFGFDPVSIMRATVKNFEAGRIVQGGSTLTQQTAKNLFKREDRSYRAKLKELLYALRLEYHYSKEEIFEFYANQFYVSGNGHGLGVAARYYFNKTPQELTLLECAFIAGSVKRPNYYNPFIQKSEEATAQALERGRERLDYVFANMLELGMISHEVYAQTLAQELEFNQGQVGYPLDYTMEIVKDAVSSDEVLAELERHGIENISTSGVRIITTVDKPIQDRAVYALRHDLSRLDTLLSGYEREEVQQQYREIEFRGDGRLEVAAFQFGTVVEVRGKGKELEIDVDLGERLGRGVIGYESILRLADSRVKWQKNRWAKPGLADVQKLADQIQPGDTVWVSIAELSEERGVRLDLEKYPLVEGGAIVIKDGAVLAMAGGVENRFFNRAIMAKRTMGSSFKPFVYAAALQLGWNSGDLLKNAREMFVFHRQPYFPRPDHTSPFAQVSMSWAGTKSENVASVWLLAHLCDYLNPVQFRDLAEHVGLTPQLVDGSREAYPAYRDRIRDEYGILVTSDIIKEAAFKAAVRNSEADFMFEDLVDDHRAFQSMNYGLDSDRFRQQLDREMRTLDSSDASQRSELQERRRMLSQNFVSIYAMRKELRSFAAWAENPELAFNNTAYVPAPSTGELFFDLENGYYVFQPPRTQNPNLQLVYRSELESKLFGMSISEQKDFWDRVRVNGLVSAAGVDLIGQQMAIEYQRLERELPYSFEVLAEVDDFRILAGLKYLIGLAREMGIGSGLQPVLSFPLGSNVVSLLETTRMYEGLITGRVTTYGEMPETEDRDSLLFIDRIESAEGELLYRPQRHEKRVLGNKASMAVGHILENVVKYGTGNSADREVRFPEQEGMAASIRDVRIPLLGKTGTANDYTNAAFIGYLPGVAEDGGGLVLDDGYGVGVYVGYDDNESMRSKSIRVSGSAGALPIWIDIVNTLLAKEEYLAKLDPVELQFSGLQLKREDIGQVNLLIDPDQGGAPRYPAESTAERNRYQSSILTFGDISSGRFNPDRTYDPFWRVAEEAP